MAVKWVACTCLYAVLKISSAAHCSLYVQIDLCACIGVVRHLCLSFNCWVKPSVAAHHACVDGSSTRKLDVLAQPLVELPLDIWYVLGCVHHSLLLIIASSFHCSYLWIKASLLEGPTVEVAMPRAPHFCSGV